MNNPNTENEIENILLNSIKADLENPSVLVPSKLKEAVKHIDKKALLEIHSSVEAAREFILLFCSYIHTRSDWDEKEPEEEKEPEQGSETKEPKEEKKTKGCPLSSKLLTNLLAPAPYLKVVEACLNGTPLKGAFIKRENYSANHHSYLYSFTECYQKGKLVEYTFKTSDVKKACRRNKKSQLKRLKKRLKNHPIVENLLAVYPHLELPSLKDLEEDGKAKCKDPDFRTKKGKKLVRLNKNPRSRFGTPEKLKGISFLEDHLKLFKSLTRPHLLIPSIQSENAGGRVTDSITLMPSWIRPHLKLNGESLSECDFKAFHPNIIVSLYGGKSRFLKHEEVAKRIGEMPNLQEPEKLKNLPLFKTDHLAFFNSTKWQMETRHKDLWNYYHLHEPEMMKALLAEKSQRGYKFTSQRMFEKEVEVMSDAVKRLNEKGIHVLYVYDALLCQGSHAEAVKETMNAVAIAHGVSTSVEAKNLASKSTLSVVTAEDHPDAQNQKETAKEAILGKSTLKRDVLFVTAA